MIRAAALLAGAWLALAAAAPADAVRPPLLNYQYSTLPNGLQVVLLEDHATPIVHLAVWYHVGSKDESASRTGIAHLFEHLMFKGSKHVQAEEHAAVITSLGGQSNAFTDQDATVFWETVPAQYLPLMLFFEADRMASLDVSAERFRTELDVVKEERRMRVENPPYGLLTEILYDKAFTTHPYKHQPIGSMASLERASLEEARAFHDTYYVPNNAAIVLAGDFEPAQATALITRYLGAVPRGRPVSRDIPAEPAHKAEALATLTEPWPLPAVAVSYHIGADGQPDAYPLFVLEKILADGNSSRLQRSLVYEQQLATAAFGDARFSEHPGLFFVAAIVQPLHTADEALAALEKEIDRVRAAGVTDDELVRAKRQWARDFILGRETLQQKALDLGHAVVIHHDVRVANTEFDAFQRVTAADVQRVAKTYFTPQSRLKLTVLPGAAK